MREPTDDEIWQAFVAWGLVMWEFGDPTVAAIAFVAWLLFQLS